MLIMHSWLVCMCCSCKQGHLQRVWWLTWAAVASADNHDGGVLDASSLCSLCELLQDQLVACLLGQHHVGRQQDNSGLRGEGRGAVCAHKHRSGRWNFSYDMCVLLQCLGECGVDC